jgi:hypothetical protein
MDVFGLTTNGKRKYLRYVYLFDRKIGFSFRIPDGGVEAGAFSLVPVILIPLESFLAVFLAFLGGLRSIGTFHLQA